MGNQKIRLLVLGLFSLLVFSACGSVQDTESIEGEKEPGGVQEPSVDYPKDPDVSSYIPENYRASAPVRVIFLGDSITSGLGASVSNGSYANLLANNDETLWPDHAGEDLASLFGAGIAVVNVAVSGATSGDVVSSQLPNLAEQLGTVVSGETLVVMTAGGNDMTRAAYSSFLQGEAALISALSALSTNLGTVIDFFEDTTRFPDGFFFYMANVYDPTDGVGQTATCLNGFDLSPLQVHFDAANTGIRDLAIERGVAMADMRGYFLGHGFYFDDETNAHYEAGDSSLWFATDCIHPNDLGHHELRRLFLATIDGRAVRDENP